MYVYAVSLTDLRSFCLLECTTGLCFRPTKNSSFVYDIRTLMDFRRYTLLRLPFFWENWLEKSAPWRLNLLSTTMSQGPTKRNKMIPTQNRIAGIRVTPWSAPCASSVIQIPTRLCYSWALPRLSSLRNMCHHLSSDAKRSTEVGRKARSKSLSQHTGQKSLLCSTFGS